MQKLSKLRLTGLAIKHAVKNVSLPSRYSQRSAGRNIRLSKEFTLAYRPESAMLAPLKKPLAEFAKKNEAVMAKRRELLKGMGMPWAQMHETLDLFRLVKAADIARRNKGVCEERAARKLCRFLVKGLSARIRRDKKNQGSVVNEQYFLSQAQKVLSQSGEREEALTRKGADMAEAVKTLLVFHPTGRKNPFYVEADPAIFSLAKIEAEAGIAAILENKKAVFHEAEIAFRKKHGLMKN